jgi:hypothetical protein
VGEAEVKNLSVDVRERDKKDRLGLMTVIDFIKFLRNLDPIISKHEQSMKDRTSFFD